MCYHYTVGMRTKLHEDILSRKGSADCRVLFDWKNDGEGYMSKPNSNPRSKNGNLRRKHRARLRAIGAPCGICGGMRGPIRYDEPSDSAHPLSFVIDEILPISKYKLYGYPSKEAAANDWNNLQAAHYICNAEKKDKTNYQFQQKLNPKPRPNNVPDGDW